MGGRLRAAIVGAWLAILPSTLAMGQATVEFGEGPGRVIVSIGGAPVADYVYQDPQITRPYFADVRTLQGTQVTRTYPPVEGTDVPDHATFHPGIWMAFGDINDHDYWRLKVPVRTVEFANKPNGGPGRGTFSVRNHYLSQRDPTQVVCTELCHFTFLVRPHGFTIRWDAQFSSDQEFAFGDQEEMGLGFRVATPLRVAQGNKENDARIVAGNGAILDADGRKNEDEVWGQSSAWCDYSGTINGQHVGITLFCHPENFRPSWFHARDYGLLLANPFGRDAFGQGEKSNVVVRPGETLRLRYGIYVHESKAGSPPDFEAAYADYVRVSK